jgi:hypothetical protein
MPDRFGTFYGIWPVLDGKPLNLQWGEIRSNQAETKAIVRNSFQELETGVDELNALRALLGQAYGDLAFSNKYRFYYDRDTLEFCLQKNEGTVAVPVWVDCWCVRFHDGQFQVTSAGGIQSSAGFYGPGLQSIEEVGEFGSAANFSVVNPTKIFFNTDDGFNVTTVPSGVNTGAPLIEFTQPFGRAQEFTKSGKEWVVEHNFGFSPVMVQVMNTDKQVVFPDTADVSDPNIAYFYFHDTVTGSVIIASGGVGATLVAPRDPFYIVVRTDEMPAADHLFQPNVDMVFDRRYFYVNVDLDADQGGAHKNVYISLTDLATQGGSGSGSSYLHTQGAASFEWIVDHNTNTTPVMSQIFDTLDQVITPDVADVSDPNTAYFYFNEEVAGKAFIVSAGATVSANNTITVEQSDGAASFSDITTASFEAENFYITQNAASPGIVQINFRGSSGGGGGVSDHGALTGLADNDHPQYARKADSQNTFSGIITAEGFYFGGVGTLSVESGNVHLHSSDGLAIHSESGQLNIVGSRIDFHTGSTHDGTPEFVIQNNSLSTRTGASATLAGFYLSPGPNGIGADLGVATIQIDIPTPSVDNYWLDSFAVSSYIIGDISLATSAGTCTVGFYILGSTETSPGGIGIVGNGDNERGNLGNFYVTKKLRNIPASSGNIMTTNDSLVMSVIETTSASHLRGRIRIHLSG